MIRIGQPATALHALIRCYAHVEAHFPTASVVQPVPARTAQAIEFTFGDPYKVRFADSARYERAHPVAIIGAQTCRRVLLELRGHVETFVIVFRPGGFSQLFSVPSDALTNQHFDCAAVLGRCMDELRSRLGESTSFAQRVRVADRYLLSRQNARRSPSGVTTAAADLLRHDGCLRIADLADKTGLSIRQFERSFASQIGLTPKLFARVARFEGALQRKKRSPCMRWTDIAHEMGYHDQPHMVRDFWQLSGSTPTDVALEVDPFDMFLAPEEVAPELDSRSRRSVNARRLGPAAT
jgi:AraC-like DNA-binding protein